MSFELCQSIFIPRVGLASKPKFLSKGRASQNLVEGNSLRINRKKGKNAVQLEGIPSASAAIQSEWTPFMSENCFQRRLCILLAGLPAEYQVLYIPVFLFHGMLLMIEMYILMP